MDLHTPRALERDLRGLSLCAGYGGLDLGLHIAESRYRTVAYVEREAHAAATLVARMEDSSLGQAPIWDDLRSFDGKPWRDRVHIVSAGYPCQPFSAAGKRRGSEDPRHLWPQVARIIDEVGPEWVFCENVEGHLDLGFAEVADELSGMGFETKAGLFTAREAGASHRRRRIFILAHSDRQRRGELSRCDDRQWQPEIGIASEYHQRQREADRDQFGGARLDACPADECGLADAVDGYAVPLFAPAPGDLRAWDRIDAERDDLQPALLRTSDGMADRLDRTRAAGNGVCSMAAALAWRTLKAAHLGEPCSIRNFSVSDL